MIGRHNVENAVAVAAMGLKLGLTAGDIEKAFTDFQGIKRRQEIVGVKNGITVIDDFAHHPTAIRRTLEAVREAYPGHRIWAVFEPRSATSRRNVFESKLPECFAAANRVILAELFAPDKIKPEERLNPKRVIEDINQNGGDAHFIPEVDAIVEKIATECRPKDVVLIMSSGGFSGIYQKLLDQL
jgi:UDP-N-acetylmuramate: L-alanyl-gamma-D-glutamyl-meso-diaminopimelate ligase